MDPYYQDEATTIYCGDCREVLPGLGRFDLLLTDPPYGISHSSNHGASWNGTVIANDADTSARDEVISRCTTKGAFIFGTWKTEPPQNMRAVLVWDKGPASGMGDLAFPWKMSHEFIYILGDGFIGRRDEGVIKGMTEITWESKGRFHPHQKPTRLIRYLIGKHIGDTILDPFMGSGATLVAAKLEGRKAVGIELEERYCEIAANRLRQGVLNFGD